MKAQVNTNRYEFAHGKKPKGRGCWAFQIGQDNDSIPLFVHNTYAAAKAEAIREAARRGEGFVYVLS